MAKLLPTTPDVSAKRDGEPSVLYLDDQRTEDVIAALSSDTAMAVFRQLNEQPLTTGELADRLEMSVQSVSYHLTNLRDAGLIEVVDTCYSEKGREMDVYTVSSDPTLVVLGSKDDGVGLRKALSQLSAAIGAPAVVIALGASLSRLVENLFEG